MKYGSRRSWSSSGLLVQICVLAHGFQLAQTERVRGFHKLYSISCSLLWLIGLVTRKSLIVKQSYSLMSLPTPSPTSAAWSD